MVCVVVAVLTELVRGVELVQTKYGAEAVRLQDGPPDVVVCVVCRETVVVVLQLTSFGAE